MREFFTSVLAGVASAVVWETIRWVFASIRAQKAADPDQAKRA